MSAEKIAVVTGSNKGIGYAIVKGLCEKFNGSVYLTARDLKRGEEAVTKLKELGFKPLFHQLDISDQASVDKFKKHIQTVHEGIDVLVNNAAIAYKMDAPESFGEQAEKTVAVNYFGTLRVCEALFPLLRTNARVVNISSSAGHLHRIPSADIRAKFSNADLTEGWGNSAYVVSKVGVSALTVIQQRLFDKEVPNRNISVNSVHPGYVDTDMTSHKGPLTIEQGAKAPLYLSLEANLKGKYVWFDCHLVDWYGETLP
ncbi:hypothetical protein NQ314_010726 [Rhamnusium bicolor]|uniref:carbonyl reductase (NADPH) n=1 Tax=Rhamnusium bicolor TaxID=1586634 RepID=A0AAV8XPQ6_9CUCU|nr:hypothetical protein NQ314_010726 [Rhamnusium bicolor]